MPRLEVRQIGADDIRPLCDYWMNASDEYLLGMGADKSKMPSRHKFEVMLENQIATPLEQKKSLALIWVYDGKAIGHNNVNDIEYGQTALMHLHLWDSANRKKGLGEAFLKNSIPMFFELLKLKELRVTPYSLNPGPNKLLLKVGFKFKAQYECTPGPINLKQVVNEYILTSEELSLLAY